MHRTYVRRRIVAVAVALGVVAVTGGPIARALGAGETVRPVSARTYVVREGDTLWSIVSSTAPGRDPREVIQLVVSAEPDAISPVPGQVLSIPVSDG
ncbi:MAG: LysM peptidoglycan-binding domain-containing protein [Actinomycetota bacterium]